MAGNKILSLRFRASNRVIECPVLISDNPRAKRARGTIKLETGREIQLDLVLQLSHVYHSLFNLSLSILNTAELPDKRQKCTLVNS